MKAPSKGATGLVFVGVTVAYVVYGAEVVRRKRSKTQGKKTYNPFRKSFSKKGGSIRL